MKHFVASYSPLQPFRHPFNFRTPMARIDYWIFYAGHIVLSSLAVMALSVLEIVAASYGVPFQISLSVIGIGVLGYLFLCMLSAVARRMVDSGYRRAGIIVSAGLLLSAFGSLVMDVSTSFDPSIPLPEAEPVVFSNLTFGLTAAGIVSLSYIFFGLIRPRAKVKGGDDLRDTAAN